MVTRKFLIVYTACILFLLGSTDLKGYGCLLVFLVAGGTDYEGICILFAKTRLDVISTMNWCCLNKLKRFPLRKKLKDRTQ